jgi:GT2 family glycosyltransferase
MTMFFSVIIPVYNRPDEINQLLKCFVYQTYKNFEILIIESGSTIKADQVVNAFKEYLSVNYFYKNNEGQGISRNFGMRHANGDYFVILDSDVYIEHNFLENIYLYLKKDWLDCYGGPDKLHPESNEIQKAIDFCMTSFLTTGGIRGKKFRIGKFYPRSFNMGFSRKVFEKTKGFKLPCKGEDIELSARIIKLGFKTGLIPNAIVYHKRKNNLSDFFKQMVFFGKARINVFAMHKETLRLIHLIPLIFCSGLIFSFVLPFLLKSIFAYLGLCLYALYFLTIFTLATLKYRNAKIGYLTVIATFYQMIGYAYGILLESFNRMYRKILSFKK